MKKKILFLITFLIFIFSFNSFAYTVSERVRIGIKYGGSAILETKIASSNGFNIHSVGSENKIIGESLSTSLNVSVYAEKSLNSYLIVEQAGFESLEMTLAYCRANGFNTVPFYSNGVFYAVRHGVYTYNDALWMQNQAKLTNITAFILDPAPTRVKITNPVSGEILLIFSQDNGEIVGLEAKDGGLLDFGAENTYRDIMEFKRVENKLYLINNITMQHYLYSVVTAEIGATAPLEAQKAQAVCARTYTEENLLRHKGDGFNLCSTTHCQAYIGTKWEREQAIRAVDETDKLIMTYNGKPISAVYFAHSGGRTANVEDVWGNPYPYLKSVEDKYCNDYTWEYKIDYNEITKKMESKGYKIGTVTNVKVTAYTDYGLVKKLTITGTNGSKTFERESARTALGLKSQCFSIPNDGISHSVKSDKGTSVKPLTTALTANGVLTLSDSILVKGGDGKTTVISAEPGMIIKGSGNGHHVGMSQHGAMGYANEGWDFRKILNHYYQGVTIGE